MNSGAAGRVRPGGYDGCVRDVREWWRRAAGHRGVEERAHMSGPAAGLRALTVALPRWRLAHAEWA
ncbi:MAG TPA: hypothetical protein VMU20_06050, partial [Candidatus Dormibacteraeota bacterium]|nr:hypothetical protein [Candidatus Dormibacteraeota bacterium]